MDNQLMFFDAVRLADASLLSSAGIKDGDTVEMMMEQIGC